MKTSSRASAHLSCLLALGLGQGFDWDRDRILLRNGREERGVVMQSFDPDHVLLLREGNRRVEIPRSEIERVDKLRDRLAAFMSIRGPGLSVESEWSLVEDASSVGLQQMARLQAYHVLLRAPEHARAHEFLGHKPAGDGWKWAIDGKFVDAARFAELSADWNHRLALESEHFAIETNCGLRRAVDVLFDLEGLYVWWMEHVGPGVRAVEDVDEPEVEKITFLVHTSKEDPSFERLDSDMEPYYDPSGESNAASGGFNVARTYYELDGQRPLRLFELGTEALMYSTLVLGRTRDEADFKLRRLSHWVEVGLGYWIARHCGGEPGHPVIAEPFVPGFTLDPATAGLSLAPLRYPHLLLKGPSELENLVFLPYFELIGSDPNVPLARARCGSFVSFLIEVNQPLGSEAGLSGSREALWRYLREVYGTQRAAASSAFDDGLQGAKVDVFEEGWKTWTASFPH